MKLGNFILLFLSFSLYAQKDIRLKINSEKLNESRSIDIHLPNSYEENSDKKYPVFYTLDGDYTKYVLNGSIDFYSFCGKIPESIVVSIKQNYKDSSESNYKRWSDCSYKWETGLPDENGEAFKSFISDELIPHIDDNYRTSNFKVIVGHSFTANFVNYFLLDENPLFSAYISISPYYAENMFNSLKEKLNNINKPIFYYVASGEKDLNGHIKSVNEFDAIFSKIENTNFIYERFNLNNNQAIHYTIFPLAIPKALEHVFKLYNPIGNDEFKTLLKTKDKIAYLKNRYEKINDVYEIKIPIREDDLNLVSYAISKKKQWEQLKKIGELSLELYPESFLGFWILGEYEENLKNYEEALKHYQNGFNKLGDDVLNKSDFQTDIDRVKKKLKV